MINNETHDIGPFFCHTISLRKDGPVYHRYPSHELDHPYRWSNSHILRLPWTSYGLVVGHWRKTERTEEQAILDAMEGRRMDHKEFSEAEKAHMRRVLIKNQINAEDQELLIDALDL